MKKSKAFLTNIEILKSILSESPDPELLKQYTGLGAFKEVLSLSEPEKFKEETKELKQQIKKVAEAEGRNPDFILNSAKRSVLTAYYTPEVLVKSIYAALQKSGTKFNKVLEPAAGVGAFLEHFPDGLKGDNFSFTAVEKDFVSSKVLEKIYLNRPDVNVIRDGFETVSDSGFDLVISNIPFGDVSINRDLEYRKRKGVYGQSLKKIHNYFFLKGSEKLKNGGVIAYVTSTGVMDSEKNRSVRQELVKKNDFLGAVRLNDKVFSDAGTSVTTDVIFLQKNEKKKGLTVNDRLFIDTKEIVLPKQNGEKTKKAVNSFYVVNPKQVLGNMELGGAYRGDNLSVKGARYKEENGLANEVTQAIYSSLNLSQYPNLELEEEDKSLKRKIGDLIGENPTSIREAVTRLMKGGYEVYVNTEKEDSNLLNIISPEDKNKGISVSDLLGYESEKSFFQLRVKGRPYFDPRFSDKVIGIKNGKFYTEDRKITLAPSNPNELQLDKELVAHLGTGKRDFRDLVSKLIRNGHELYVNQNDSDKETLYIVKGNTAFPVSSLLGLKDEQSFFDKYIYPHRKQLFKEDFSNVVMSLGEGNKVQVDKERKIVLPDLDSNKPQDRTPSPTVKLEEVPVSKEMVTETSSLTIKDYSAKSLVVLGTTIETGKALKDYFISHGVKSLGYNSHLRDEEGKRFSGWIVPKKHSKLLEEYINGLSKDDQKTEIESPKTNLSAEGENLASSVTHGISSQKPGEKIDSINSKPAIPEISLSELSSKNMRDSYILKCNLLDLDLPPDLETKILEQNIKGFDTTIELKYNTTFSKTVDIQHFTIQGDLASKTGFRSHFFEASFSDLNKKYPNAEEGLKGFLKHHFNNKYWQERKQHEDNLKRKKEEQLKKQQLGLFSNFPKTPKLEIAEKKQEEKNSQIPTITLEDLKDASVRDHFTATFDLLEFGLSDSLQSKIQEQKEQGVDTTIKLTYLSSDLDQHWKVEGELVGSKGVSDLNTKQRLASLEGNPLAMKSFVKDFLTNTQFNEIFWRRKAYYEKLKEKGPLISSPDGSSTSKDKKLADNKPKVTRRIGGKLNNSQANTLEVMRNLQSGQELFKNSDLHRILVSGFDSEKEEITISLINQQEQRTFNVKEFHTFLEEAREGLKQQEENYKLSKLLVLNHVYQSVLSNKEKGQYTIEDGKTLNREYWNTVAEIGFLHEGENRDHLLKDREEGSIMGRSFLLLGLENWNNRRKRFEGVATILDISEKQEHIEVDEPLSEDQALAYSLNLRGKVDTNLIEKVTKGDWPEIEKVLLDEKRLIFKNPNSNSKGEEEYQVRASYLSGNISQKLKDNESLKGTRYYQINKEELEKVKVNVLADELDLNLGERWIPTGIYTSFIQDDLGFVDCTINYKHKEDKFKFEGVVSQGLEDTWGNIGHFRARDIIECAFAHNLPNVTFRDVEGKTFVHREETQRLHAKINEVRERFSVFWRKQEKIKESLLELYNDNQVTVPASFDGSHLSFDDINPDIIPYDHQKDTVWMLTQNDGGIADHMVGSGKTITMFTSAMKMKQLGMAKKPLITVMKATLSQMEKEFKRLYPNANLLVPGPNDLTKEGRKEFLAKMLNNEYDCVIMTHEQFGKIPQDRGVEEGLLLEGIKELEDEIIRMENETGTRASKQILTGLEKRKEKLEGELEYLQKSMAKDEGLPTFREIGTDHLFVDESQKFKNLWYTTRHSRVAGLGDPTGSQKANNLLTAIRDIQERKGGDKGVTFLSGTTISNSLVELFLLFKYLRPQKLKEMKMETFDSWAASYAEKSSDFEFSVTNELKRKERFRSFIKVPELAALYSEIADIRNDKNLTLDKPNGNFQMITIPSTPEQKAFNEELISYVQTSSDKAKMLIATNQSRKMSVLTWLVGEGAEDDPNNKLSIISNNVAKIYEETKEHRGTQLIFSDIGVPNDDGRFNVYAEIKRKLIEHGVKAEDIAFIHDYNSDKRKQELFRQMNAGEKRILLGSTEKMGTGVNVQERCAALHHVDIPWRPADMEQRNGRGVRQKNWFAKEHNKNSVDVFMYATERTLDAFQYELLRNKQNIIDQIKDGSVGRRIDEGAGDDESGMNYAEYVALLSGNDDLLKKVKLEKKVGELEGKQKLFNDNIKRHDHNIDRYQREIASFEKALEIKKRELKYIHSNFKTKTKEGKEEKLNLSSFTGMSLQGDTIEKFEEVGQHLKRINMELIQSAPLGSEHELGSYLGFALQGIVKKDWGQNTVEFSLKSPETGIRYKYKEGIIPADSSLNAFASLVRNAISKIEEDAHRFENRSIPGAKQDLEFLKNQEIEREWPEQQKLDDLKEEYSMLIAKLDANDSPGQMQQKGEEPINKPAMSIS
ncbi:Eco57I restriction-modification methylase domain-containing protein [Xanthovirga aplysinae]|uniref:Eco57I restriction-modification methylase domain-containing protein n=1 Tax=Xanthovirga aplysinae TaxID=2529853 RepID=UPI0012BB76F0|nr:helicase-related protein [Xanthovirga aplysinae]